MIPVIAQLIFDIKDQKQPKGYPDGEAKNIEETVPVISLKIAEGNEQEVFYHVWLL